MEIKLVAVITGILLTTIIGLIGFWLRTVYMEFKQLLKELNAHINELTQTVSNLQTHINKAIEQDIDELKANVKVLFKRTNRHESSIKVLNKNADIDN